MALILPEPPQSFDQFGLNLNGYLAQPGSAFVVNRYGFDTGHRRFIVNTSVADIGAFALGTPDFKYPKMYVHKVTNEVIGGPWTIADIEYLGQIYPNKPHEISTDADIRKTGLTLAINVPNVGLTVTSFQVEVSEVTVQDVYVTDIMPDLNLSGSAVSAGGYGVPGLGGTGTLLSPPIALPPPNLDSIDAAVGLPSGTLRIFSWWWELRRRAMRIAGTPPSAASSGAKRFLSGKITLHDQSKTINGTNTKFTADLAPGDRIFAVTPPSGTAPNISNPISIFAYYLGLEFQQGFTIQTIVSDTEATLNTVFYQFVTHGNFSGSFYTFDAAPVVTTGTSTALYEVTDSWKRVVMLLGEPLANAFNQ